MRMASPTYGYDAVGNRASQLNANGVTVSYSYDQLNRLEDLVHTDSLNNTITSYSYELGPNGNRLSLTEGTGRVVEYAYDSLYRLLTETVTDSINGNHTSAWSYDAVGNRLQQTIDGVVTTYSYNDNDYLLSETENSIMTSYGYDANGNTLEKVVDGLVDTTYSYSKDNRMLTANTGTSSISYTYDAGGIRQSQTVDGMTTHYLVDPNRSYHQVLEEQDSLFIPQVVYTYGDDLINQTNAQGIHTFGYDGLGSTRILTDINDAVQNSYGYQAFGELDYQYGTIENNYLFTGEQYDNNVGFYYLRARYYNPSIGRFHNMDVFPGMQFEPVTLHKYLYANVNPVSVIDPSGYFGLVEMGVVQTIRGIINSFTVDSSFELLSAGLGMVGAEDAAHTVRQVQTFVAIATLGAAGVALTRVLAKKFFKLSAAAKFNKFRNGLFGDLPAVKPRSSNVSSPPPGGVTTIDHVNINQLSNDKVYIYVVDESNNLKVALRGDAKNGIKHTQLINSGPAKAGGEFVVSGKSVSLNRETGRYRAHSDQALGRVKALFNSQEFSVNLTGPL